MRLRDGREVVTVLRGGRHRAGRLLAVHARPRDAQHDPDHGDRTSGARVAVVASRRIGSATRRNRAKRLLRETARRLPLRAGYDVVLVARAACVDSHLDAVYDESLKLAAQLDVLEAGAASPGTAADAEHERLTVAGGPGSVRRSHR
ncbi:MAG: ribonuclease P protein component [Nitriliruptoraceae bacterium]